jgi:hypothetical protein
LSIREALDIVREQNLLWRNLGGKDTWVEREAYEEIERSLLAEFKKQERDEIAQETSGERNN